MSLNFCFIGAGNLATHLSKAFQNKGFNIIQVFSRTDESAKLLANMLSTGYTTSTSEIDKTADIYFIALKDSVVEEVLPKIDFGNKLIVHCSGSLPLNAINSYSENRGVFYPLQTFSKMRNIDFQNIPVFIEANSVENENLLQHIAGKISDSVYVADYEKRLKLHISAVFACNFVNYLYSVSGDILASENIPFDVLKPLIYETAAKVQKMNPDNSQTGPAVRFDENIIKLHLKELENSPNYMQLYDTISNLIFKRYNK